MKVVSKINNDPVHLPLILRNKFRHMCSKHFKIIPLLFLISFFGCQENGTEEKTIEEIQSEGKISSIIRSPVTANGPQDTVNVAKMVFDEMIYNFETVNEGDMVKHTFHFTNTGKIPLIINDAHSTCGCTVPKWPNNPVSPGGKGTIKVEFNTKNKIKQQEKPIIISANTYPSVTKVYLRGYVITC